MKIAELSIKRPSLVLVFLIFGILAGALSFPLIGFELLPKISPPVLTVMTVYPGAAPSEVENSVTRKVEDALSSLENIDTMQARSLEGASLIIVNFKAGTDIDFSLEDAQRKVNNMLSDLPDDALTPSLTKLSPDDLPIMQISATSKLDPRLFYAKMENDLLPQLQKLKGVAKIDLLGGEQREIRVAVDRARLEHHGIPLLAVTEAIRKGNLEFPTGKVKEKGDQITVRLAGKYASPADIEDQIVASRGGSTVRVKDVATVTDGSKDVGSVARLDGNDAIVLRITKQNDANTVAVSKLVKGALVDLEKRYTADGLAFTIASDSADFTIEAATAVEHDLVLAIALVAAVMLLFLHSIRNALIVMVSIPASLVSTVAVMYLLGYTFNLMTLLGMSLVIGILVDDSIVVLENIYRHMEMGKTALRASIDGIAEIGFTAVSITLVIVVVFLPVTFAKVIIADVFRQFSWTVAIATLFSLFWSVTLIPFLTSRFARVSHPSPRNPFGWVLIKLEAGLSAINRVYVDALEVLLKRKWALGGVVVALFVGLGWVMAQGTVGQEQFSSGDKGELKLTLEYDKTTTVERNNLRTRDIEEKLRKNPEIASVLANVGGSTTGFGATGLGDPYKSELKVKLVPATERKRTTEQILTTTMEELRSDHPGLKVGGQVSGMMEGSAAPINLVLTGDDYDAVLAAARELKYEIAAIPGANDVNVSVEAGNPEVRIEVDRDKMARLGLDIASVGATLQNAFAGNDDAKYRDGDYEYDIRVQLDAFDRASVDDVKGLSFVTASGDRVKLAQFAEVTRDAAPSMLERRDRRKAVSVTAFTLGVPSGTLSQVIQKKLDAGLLPPGISYAWEGDVKGQAESFGALGTAFGISLILMYLIMVLLYDSFVYPLVVIASVPVALIGALYALAMTKSTMSVFTILGVIMLLGLVAKNAILIVDFANQAKARGASTREALLEAGKERLRPILMTTIAMVIGMLPIALAKGAGSEWKNGLAWVIVGGLTSSLLLTIFVVPALYELVDTIKAFIGKISARLSRRAPEPQPAAPEGPAPDLAKVTIDPT